MNVIREIDNIIDRSDSIHKALGSLSTIRSSIIKELMIDCSRPSSIFDDVSLYGTIILMLRDRGLMTVEHLPAEGARAHKLSMTDELSEIFKVALL